MPKFFPAIRAFPKISKSLRSFKSFILKPFISTTNCTANTVGNDSRQIWDGRIKLWLRRYEDIFGITKLTEMHNKVTEVQKKVEDVQEKRRKVQQDFLSVQGQLQEVQAKLEKISRGDDLFISIVTKEHELIKEQKRLNALLEVYYKTEREQQTDLAIAINSSQDYERTYREKNKYLSLITGVIGGMLGIIGSSMNNWRHRKDIKLFAEDISNLIRQQNEIIIEHQPAVQEETLEPNSASSNMEFDKVVEEFSKQVENLNCQFENRLDSKIRLQTYTSVAMFIITSALIYIFNK